MDGLENKKIETQIMTLYLVRMAIFTLSIVLINILTMLLIPNNMEAEYWVRELIIIKRSISQKINQPKIILLGGSSTLFGIDAKKIERETNIPTVNLGLHAGLGLSYILNLGREVSKPNDLIILPLELNYYSCDQSALTSWQLNNYSAWDREYFDSLPLKDRLRGAISDPLLYLRVIVAYIHRSISPSVNSERRLALGKDSEILMRFNSGQLKPDKFAYSAYNLDDRGDILHTDGSFVGGNVANVLEPKSICPETKLILSNFVDEMHKKNTKVIFSYPPYLIDGNSSKEWEKFDVQFKKEVQGIGAKLLSPRDMNFYPHNLFFNMNSHMNEAGREKNTLNLIRFLVEVNDLKPN